MKEYFINDLSGFAWETAIKNVANELNKVCGIGEFDSVNRIETIAYNTSMKFDADGEFIKNR